MADALNVQSKARGQAALFPSKPSTIVSSCYRKVTGLATQICKKGKKTGSAEVGFPHRRDSARGDRDGRGLPEAGTKWSAMARPADDLAALERAQLFGSDIQAPHTRAAERFGATGGRTGELREDWRGAFVVTHIGRAGPIVQGAH
jgi:hypothetical protein